jgi:hypothetical protein
MRRQLLTVTLILALCLTGFLAAESGRPPVDNSADTFIPAGGPDRQVQIEEGWNEDWIESGPPPVTFKEWQASTADKTPFSITLIRDIQIFDPLDPPPTRGIVLIVVNSSLYNQITTSIGQYSQDIRADGYQTLTYVTLGGTPEDLRNWLYGRYVSLNNVVGVSLVGDLPIAWWQSTFDPIQFPCNYFYMDLDGGWADTNQDGVYDDLTGNNHPEIFAGLLHASNLTYTGQTEAQLMTAYFAKDHQYRRRTGYQTPHKVLRYHDGWGYMGEGFDRLLRSAYYHDQTLVLDQYVTTADDYELRLNQGFEYVILYAHGGPHSNWFSDDSFPSTSTWYYDVIAAQP